MEENGRTFVATLLEVMIAAPPFKISEVAGIIAFLTCSHRVQLHVVEDTLVEFLVSQGSHPPARADLTDAKVWWLVSKLLVHWFPRTKGSSWGWSRPGWTWQEWLLLTDRLLERLPEAQAFDVLKGAVEAMEDMDGEKLHAQPCWTASRLEKLRGRMRALAGLTDDAMLSARLGPLGVWGPLHAGARVQLRGLVAEVSLNGKKGVCRNYQPPGVCFTMAVSLGRYAELLASPLLLSGFKARVSEAVAEVAASGARLSTGPEAKVVGLRPEHVDVAMSAGAPGLKVSIAPPADVAFDAVQSHGFLLEGAPASPGRGRESDPVAEHRQRHDREDHQPANGRVRGKGRRPVRRRWPGERSGGECGSHILTHDHEDHQPANGRVREKGRRPVGRRWPGER